MHKFGLKKFGASLMSAALLLPSAAFAQDVEAAADEDMLPYDAPLKCAALSTFFSASESEAEDSDAEQVALHDDMGERFLYMAIVRDGADGGVASAEFEPLIERLIAKIESFGEDMEALEAFLTEGAEACGELRSVYQEEFDAIELEEDDEEVEADSEA